MKTRTSQPRVVIVGAGMAGCAAAWTLKDADVEVLLLEGQDRVGGRIHTIAAGASSAKVELGANWIHGLVNNPVYEFCLRQGIFKKKEPFGTGVTFVSEGGKMISPVLGKKAEKVWKKLVVECSTFYQEGIETPAEFEDSLEKFMDSRLKRSLLDGAVDEAERRDLEGLSRQIKGLEREAWGSDQLSEISLSRFGMYQELEGGETLIRDGWSSLVDYLVEGSGAKVTLGAVVESIVLGASDPPVRVLLSDGTEVSADTVIVTVSIGCLKAGSIRFIPDLPEAKREAIYRIPFGVVEKIILELTEDQSSELRLRTGDVSAVRFGWNSDADVDDLKHTWTRSLYGFDFVNVDVVLLWVIGPEARYVHGLDDVTLLQNLADAFATFLKLPLPWIFQPKRLLRTRWFQNEFTRGSYSILTGRDARVCDASDLGSPVIGEGGAPRLLFAGEATHRKWFGSVHGAFETGVREANRIINHLNTL